MFAGHSLGGPTTAKKTVGENLGQLLAYIGDVMLVFEYMKRTEVTDVYKQVSNRIYTTLGKVDATWKNQAAAKPYLNPSWQAGYNAWETKYHTNIAETTIISLNKQMLAAEGELKSLQDENKKPVKGAVAKKAQDEDLLKLNALEATMAAEKAKFAALNLNFLKI